MEALMIQLRQVQIFQTHIPMQIPYLLYPLYEETTKWKIHFETIFSSQITGNQLFPNIIVFVLVVLTDN
jgi:hypothetical protein